MCMATDRTLVCKDLEACLEALYDLFNQFFTQILGKRWVDIGLGNERMQCPVGDRFRVIILAKENQVASFPIPLLNRLEKHRLQIEDTLDSGGLRVVADLKQKLMAWQNKSALVGKAKDRIESDLSISLPGYYSDTIPSLVACSRSANDGLEQISLLLLTATPEFILSSNDDGIRQLYFEQQKHSSLEHYLQSSVGASTCPSDSLRAVVTTYDTLPSQGAIKGQVGGVCAEVGIVEVRHLEDFQTQMAFDFALCDYRKKCIEQRHNFFILVISTIASGNNNGGIIHQALRMLDSLSSCNDKMKSHTIVLLKLLRSQPQERRFHAIFDRTWKRVYIDSIVPIWSSPSPSIWDFWQAGHLSALLLQKRTVSRSLLCEVLEANLHHAVARLATMKTQSSWQPLMHIWTLQQMISHKQFTPAVESRILQILTNRESRAQRPNAWIENLCQNHRACLSVVGTLSRAIKHHIENQIVSILTALLACCACDGGFEILDSIVADTDDLWVQEKRSIWIAVVSAGTESNQPFMDIPTPTENGFQNMVGIQSHSKGEPFVAKFPFSWAVYGVLEGMVTSLAAKGNFQIENIIGLMAGNSGLSLILKQVKSDKMIECYIHDFIRMAYLPAHDSDNELKVFEMMISNEVGQSDGTVRLDAQTSFASIHSIWLKPHVAASTLHLRTIFLEVPAISDSLCAHLSSKQCSAREIERVALVHALRALAPKEHTLMLRGRISAWTASVRTIKPVIEAIIRNNGQDADFCSTAHLEYNRLGIAALFAEMVQGSEGKDISEFWDTVLHCPEFFSGKGLTEIIQHLLSMGRGVSSFQADAGSFLARVVEEFFSKEFVASEEIELNQRFEIQLGVDADAPHTKEADVTHTKKKC